jgi:flagellar protein FliS
MEVGGPAKTLSEFYAAIFALCLEGSRLSSPDRFRKAVECILNVREAWQQVAQDPEVRRQVVAPVSAAIPVLPPTNSESGTISPSRWTA